MAMALMALAIGGWAAQEGPSAAELKRMYDDVVGQLKGAQARRNELAAENEKLTARIAEMEKQMKALQARNASMEMEVAGFAERTWQLRSTVGAWREFLSRDPQLKAKWERFLSGDGQGSLGVNGGDQPWLGRSWPLPSGM
jgi:chromosome segregation ATPase